MLVELEFHHSFGQRRCSEVLELLGSLGSSFFSTLETPTIEDEGRKRRHKVRYVSYNEIEARSTAMTSSQWSSVRESVVSFLDSPYFQTRSNSLGMSYTLISMEKSGNSPTKYSYLREGAF